MNKIFWIYVCESIFTLSLSLSFPVFLLCKQCWDGLIVIEGCLSLVDNWRFLRVRDKGMESPILVNNTRRHMRHWATHRRACHDHSDHEDSNDATRRLAILCDRGFIRVIIGPVMIITCIDFIANNQRTRESGREKDCLKRSCSIIIVIMDILNLEPWSRFCGGCKDT